MRGEVGAEPLFFGGACVAAADSEDGSLGSAASAKGHSNPFAKGGAFPMRNFLWLCCRLPQLLLYQEMAPRDGLAIFFLRTAPGR
jgi:hypothetical protein